MRTRTLLLSLVVLTVPLGVLTDASAVPGKGNPPPGGPATITEYSIPAGTGGAHGVAQETGLVGAQQGGGRNIWVGLFSGHVMSLDPQTGVETTYTVPGSVTDLRVTPTGDVWFNTSSGDLGRLDPTTSTGTMYDTNQGFLDWLVLDQFGNVWSTELGGTNILKLDPSTGLATTWSAGAGNTGLAIRRSGDVWWCERGTGDIGRLDPGTNLVTHYTTPFTAIEGCALDPIGDPQGEVWVTPGFAGSPSDGVGMLDPRAGTFTLYTTPTANSAPYGIAIGCAGSVVFGEDFANKVGVLSPSAATGVTSTPTVTTATVAPVTFLPTATPFTPTVTTSTAVKTTATSTATKANGFAEYPTLNATGEGPHLLLIGPDEKIVTTQFNRNDGDKVIELELPPNERCRNP